VQKSGIVPWVVVDGEPHFLGQVSLSAAKLTFKIDPMRGTVDDTDNGDLAAACRETFEESAHLLKLCEADLEEATSITTKDKRGDCKLYLIRLGFVGGHNDVFQLGQINHDNRELLLEALSGKEREAIAECAGIAIENKDRPRSDAEEGATYWRFALQVDKFLRDEKLTEELGRAPTVWLDRQPSAEIDGVVCFAAASPPPEEDQPRLLDVRSEEADNEGWRYSPGVFDLRLKEARENHRAKYPDDYDGDTHKKSGVKVSEPV
jgi:hypothetical protein